MVSSSMSSAKLVLVSTAALSVAVAVVASAPAVMHFFLHQAPAIWSSIAAWLRPPYLYLVFNFIIITIAASSRFHPGGDDDHHIPLQPEEDADVELLPVGPTPEALEAEAVSPPVASSPEREELMDGAVSCAPLPADDNKPLVSLSSRFGHRKPVRSTPDGARALRVSRPKRHETMENTWKTITEGRPMPLTRHLKKAETFSENENNHTNVDQAMVMRKSETFRDRTNQQLPLVVGPSPKLRKEPLLDQDELNRRVEAFIRKFNEEMRLQRQESLNQCKEMIIGGV